MKLALGIEHNGGNPNGGCTEGLDIIQFLFNALEITAVDSGWVAGSVRAFGIIVVGISVVKAVGDELVDALGLPEKVGCLRVGVAEKEKGQASQSPGVGAGTA